MVVKRSVRSGGYNGTAIPITVSSKPKFGIWMGPADRRLHPPTSPPLPENFYTRSRQWSSSSHPPGSATASLLHRSLLSAAAVSPPLHLLSQSEVTSAASNPSGIGSRDGSRDRISDLDGWFRRGHRPSVQSVIINPNPPRNRQAEPQPD
jgi:hypothetical protein